MLNNGTGLRALVACAAVVALQNQSWGQAPYFPQRNLTPLPAAPNDHPVTARLLLQVPVGAQIWVQGQQYDVGTSHIFESPELKTGETFTFEVRVVWTENRKNVEEKRTLVMKAGDFQSMQYISAAPLPPPKPGKLLTLLR